MQTRMYWWSDFALLTALLTAACGDERLSVGKNPVGIVDGSVPTPTRPDAQPVPTLEAGAGQTLALTLGADVALPVCRGECVVVQALPSGGNAPYTITFQGGEAVDEQKRRFCPTGETLVEATVADSATGGEFGSAQQATANLTLELRDCDDAGSPTQPSLCLSNPSFEETREGEQMNFWSSGWTACNEGNYTVITPNSILADAFGARLPAADGETHVTLISGTLNDGSKVHGAISQQLCAAMRAGTRQQLAFASYTVSGRALLNLPEDRARVRIWGSMSECGEEELLWESPYLRDSSDWQQVCASFVPSKAFTHLRLATDSDDLNGRYLHLDDLRTLPAEQTCP